jgi:hypothetical protein
MGVSLSPCRNSTNTRDKAPTRKTTTSIPKPAAKLKRNSTVATNANATWMKTSRIISEKRRTTRKKSEEKEPTTSSRKSKATRKTTRRSSTLRNARGNYTNGSIWKRPKSSSEKDSPNSSQSFRLTVSTGCTSASGTACCMRISSPWRSTTTISSRPVPSLHYGSASNPPTSCQNSTPFSIPSWPRSHPASSRWSKKSTSSFSACPSTTASGSCECSTSVNWSTVIVL